MINQYCEECGISSSITYNQDLKDHQVNIDEKLDEIGKVRIPIRGNDHCLPPAVFCGCKLSDFLEQCITHKNLLKLKIKVINDN